MSTPAGTPPTAAAVAAAAATSGTTLSSLPGELLLHTCDLMSSATLNTLCGASACWRHLIQTRFWARRLATVVGVRAVHFAPRNTLPPTLRTLPRAAPRVWLRLLRTVEQVPSCRVLYVCVLLSAHAPCMTSLALRYGVSVHDIRRANALFRFRS